MRKALLPLGVLVLGILSCSTPLIFSTPTPLPPTPVDRYALLPSVKFTPEMDYWPPQVMAGWSEPVPLPFPVNTSGGEDSPFILPDDQTLYFFFTPDVNIPATRQLSDGVTGIWVTYREGQNWSEPQRVLLAEPGEMALDGCGFILGDNMLFCSARQGYDGINWFSADFQAGAWTNWQYAGDDLKQKEYEVGELHITSDGQELYFHSARPGGCGGVDLWVSRMTAAGWGAPENLGPAVNTSADDSRPFVSMDGQELWYTGQSRQGSPGPAVFHSTRQADGSWGEPLEVVSSFAGEPSLSEDGSVLYFIHHFFSKDMSTMLEADIYVTYRLP